jgi:cytochrome b
VHVTLGYTLAGLVAFRVVWGFIGTRHARFTNFVRRPAAAVGYLRWLLAGRSGLHAGHNPAGALAIVAMLTLAVGVTASGWLTYAEWGGDRFEDAHEALANLMLGLVGVHVAAVVVSSRLYRDNLVLAMFTGRKAAPPAEGIRRAWHGLAVLMLVTVLCFWWLQWRDAPTAGPTDRAHASQRADHDEHEEEDED